MNKFFLGIGLLLSMSLFSHAIVSRDTPVDKSFTIVNGSEEVQANQDALVQVGSPGVPIQAFIAIIVAEEDLEGTDVTFNFSMRGNPLNRHPDAV